MKLQSSVKYTNTVLTKEYMLKCKPIDLYYFHKESQEKKKRAIPHKYNQTIHNNMQL